MLLDVLTDSRLSGPEALAIGGVSLQAIMMDVIKSADSLGKGGIMEEQR
jgi:hypothetical protein